MSILTKTTKTFLIIKTTASRGTRRDAEAPLLKELAYAAHLSHEGLRLWSLGGRSLVGEGTLTRKKLHKRTE